jgi:hypothetical protein
MAVQVHRLYGLGAVLTAVILTVAVSRAGAPETGGIMIQNLAPDPRGGQAYRLIYRVPLPVQVFWRFKTDFGNSFVEENRYILKHRLISRQGNTVITENRYTDHPDALFRWRTTIFPQSLRLEFILLNPDQSGQRFHYGYIQLTPVEQVTLVTQVAYYDFFGSLFWSHYPWRGGRKAFLEYTAAWERETALRLRERYMGAESDAKN